MAVTAQRKTAPVPAKTAQKTARAPAPPPHQRSKQNSNSKTQPANHFPPAVRISAKPSLTAIGNVPEAVKSVVTSPGQGNALPARVQQAIENSLNVDLNAVRVHSDSRTNAAVDRLGARAFSYGTHIYLGSHENTADVSLLTHEAAHVIQQQDTPSLQTKIGSTSSNALELEADSASAAARRGDVFFVAGRTSGPAIQCQEKEPSYWERGTKWLSDTAGKVIEFSEPVVWGLLNELAPELVPIIRQGPLEWLKERVSSALEAVFDSMMAPVRTIMGAGRWLSGQFAPLIAWVQEASAKIVQNDCSPMREAAEKIEQCALKLITPVVEKLQAIAEKVKGWFTGLWDKFGAPVWNWIKQFAGSQWEQLKKLASLIWEKAAPIRKRLATAWTWIKNKLGIGEGVEGQNGLLQWVQDKLAVAWDWVKAKLEPFKKELLVLAGVAGSIALLTSPAGPLIAIGGLVYGILQGIRWIKANFGKGDGVVRGRIYLEKTLIPSLLGGLNKATAAVSRMATTINGTLGRFAAGMGRLVSSAAASMLKFVVGAVQWIANQITELAQWGSEKLATLSTWVTTTFAKLQKRLQPLLDFLGKVSEVVLDIMKLPMFVFGELWKMVPQCLRNLFVDFLVNQIIKRIPIVKDVIELLPGIWSKLKATGLMLIRKIFKDGDLMGAAFEIFKLVLAALMIPMELVTGIIRKAATARDMILKDPLGFLGNMLSAIKRGFIQFGEKIWKHLSDSIVNWLRGVIESAGLKPPADFSLPSVLEFILQVLGLTVDKVLARLEEKLGKEKTDKIRKTLSTIAKVWEWISTALNEGPQGVWNNLKYQLGDLWGALLDGAIGWVTSKVTKIAVPRITAALGTAPIGAVVEAIIFLYKAMQTATQYAKRILELVSSVLDGVLDIARGAIAGAAAIVESSLGRALTVVIGFFANYLGLGDLGKKLKEIVESIQEKVSKAIDWVIDKAIALGKGIINVLTKVAKSVLKWWKARVNFESEDGVSHAILTKGEPPNVRVMVKSDETELDVLVAKVANTKPAMSKQAESQSDIVQKVMKELADLSAKGLVADNSAAAKAKEDRERRLIDKSKEFDKALTAMADILKKAGVLDDSSPELSEYNSGPSGQPIYADAFITANRRSGSAPEGGPTFPVGWKYLMDTEQVHTMGRAGSKNFVKMHLINHNLGGKGDASNLTPGPNQANGEMERWFEKPMKRLVGEEKGEAFRGAVKVNVKVHYGRGNVVHKANWRGKAYNVNEHDFPDRITGDFSYCFRPKKGGKFTPGGNLDVKLDPPIWD